MAVKNWRFFRAGTVWGDDIILDSAALIDHSQVQAPRSYSHWRPRSHSHSPYTDPHSPRCPGVPPTPQAVAITYMEGFTLSRNSLDEAAAEFPAAMLSISRAATRVRMQRALIVHCCDLSGTKPRSFVPQKHAAGFYFAPTDVTLERKVEQIRSTLVWSGHLSTHADREVAELEAASSPSSLHSSPAHAAHAAHAKPFPSPWPTASYEVASVGAAPSRLDGTAKGSCGAATGHGAGVGTQLAELNATVQLLVSGLATLSQSVEVIAAERMQSQAASHAAILAAVHAGLEAKRRRTHGALRAAGDGPSPARGAVAAGAVADGGSSNCSPSAPNGATPASLHNGGGTPAADNGGSSPPGAHAYARGAGTGCEGELGEEPAPRSTAKQKSRPHRAHLDAPSSCAA